MSNELDQVFTRCYYAIMTKEQLIMHIFANANGISDIIDNYDEENLELFLSAPDAVLQKMASVIGDAHRHLDQHLSVFQPEFDKIRQEDYDDD